jgi:hypothetical protein
MDPNEGAPAGFNACFLVKKDLDEDPKIGCKEASWDGTHIIMCEL